MTLHAQTHLKKLTNKPLEKGILNLEDVVNQKFSSLYCTAKNVKASIYRVSGQNGPVFDGNFVRLRERCVKTGVM